MPNYTFHQLDVFTNQSFGGNPLAVFPDATGLTDDLMQHIALEMNLSETTFVFPPENSDADFKVRIFTPTVELPFAGHPVVGTHWMLANLGRVKLQEPVTRVKFALGVGIRAAALHVQNGQVTKVVMDHQKPEFYAKATPDQISELARGLGLAPAAILDTNWPVQVVSTGIRQLFVPVRSLKEVQAMSVGNQDTGVLLRVCEALDPVDQAHGSIMVFCMETVSSAANIHTRMFVPGVGIPEDPATGSASGGLGAYLVENCVVSATVSATSPTTYITTEQGLEMGRASQVEIEVDGTPGAIQMVRVGGQAVKVVEGTLAW